MKKLGRGTAIVIAVFLFLLILIFCSWRWFSVRNGRVLAGFASPTFPYSDYSIAELEKIYPQYIENNAPTVQSPEETHQKFLAALKKGDFDEAVNCCFREGDRVGMKTRLDDIKSKGNLSVMIGDLNTELKSDLVQNMRASYTYRVFQDGKTYINSISFIKSEDGIWYIESL